jgi:hypothetical protein
MISPMMDTTTGKLTSEKIDSEEPSLTKLLTDKQLAPVNES